MDRRSLAGLILAAATTAAAAQAPPGLWFDPTQLPSFTGNIERFLVNTAGETDGLLFREGPQVIIPPPVGDRVREAVPVGRPVVIWGIRARSAPVITMLAWAPDASTEPSFVERPWWKLPAFDPPSAMLEVQGEVRSPYFSPQGEPVGVILTDGTVVRMPAEAVALLGDKLKPGAKLAVEGHGSESPRGRALIAERIGPAADKLEPIPAR